MWDVRSEMWDGNRELKDPTSHIAYLISIISPERLRIIEVYNDDFP